MNRWPETQSTLLQRMSDPRDDAAWIRFDELYRPVIYRYARSRGLQHADAESLVAEVMVRVFRAARRWAHSDTHPAAPQQDRPRHFRGWLHRVAENSLLNLVTRQLARRGTGGTSHQLSINGRPTPDDESEQAWRREHRQQLFTAAARMVQAQCDPDQWIIFWKTHVDGQVIAEVANEFDRSIGSVYAIRSRMVRRLRECVDRLERLEDQPWTSEGQR